MVDIQADARWTTTAAPSPGQEQVAHTTMALSPGQVQVNHITINRRYKIQFEQAASTKGIFGFKVEVNSDSLEDVKREAMALFEWAKAQAPNLSEVR